MRLVISLRLDRHVFFHAQPQHQVLHALAAEDAHQIVLQGEIEARAAGIALASGASAKLIVDAAGFVPLGAEDVQAAERDHFVVFLRICAWIWLKTRVPFRAIFVADGVRILVLLAQALAREELRIAAQQNVGAAAGHVGGNRDRALAAGLRDDERFALVILGVQHFMPHAHLLQNARQLLGFFDRDRAHQHRLAFLVQLLDFLGGVAEFFFFGAVDDVLIFLAEQRLVGGNHA